MRRLFAPGCALMLYNPDLASRLLEELRRHASVKGLHLTCCRHEPGYTRPTELVNVCPGCDRRFRTLYPMTSTISLWELLEDCDWFPFPDYREETMTVLDACPVRDQDRVHRAVRAVLRKMYINVVEPEKTMSQSVCCGDSFYGTLPKDAVMEQIRTRVAQMPVDDVVVYCVSCIKAVAIGGKTPRYLVDLLYGHATDPDPIDPDEWHALLDKYIEAH
jgi:Fe-S oxidoreductase